MKKELKIAFYKNFTKNARDLDMLANVNYRALDTLAEIKAARLLKLWKEGEYAEGHGNSA